MSDNPQRIVAQQQGMLRRRRQPSVDLTRFVRITGIAFGWIGVTTAFGSVVRKAKRSFSDSPSLTLRTDFQRVQIPAKKASGRLSSIANQAGAYLK